MDATTAKDLLTQISQVKQMQSKQAGWGESPTQIAESLKKHYNQLMQQDAKKDIARIMLLGLGTGAAVRGLAGLNNMLTDPAAKKPPRRVVEMPVPYLAEDEEKTAANEAATSKIGLNYYIPGMILGGLGAGYGGWKAIDLLLNNQRKKKTEEELEAAKKEYEQSLLGSYKTASDNPVQALDRAFDLLTKQADLISEAFPNLPGMASGLATTYSLATLPIGYMIINRMMKKNSNRAILNKALEERARRQAIVQPPQLYATPVAQKDEVEKEEN